MKSARGALLKNSQQEARLFRARAVLAVLLVGLSMAALASRFVWLQVSQHEELVTRSEANRVRARPVVPARGLIFDRNGRLLADNVPAYRLEIIPEQIADIDTTLTSLSEFIPLDDEELARFAEVRRGQRSFQAVPLKFRLSEAEVASFAVRRHEFPGVEVVPYLTRRYPHGELLAHVVGYVGRIDADDLIELDPVAYRGATHIGKAGIERQYESLLHGDVGIEQVEINAEGRVLQLLDRRPATIGEHLYLSIDVVLQEAAVAAFDGQNGAAVAIDPRNGEILAFVSLPSYDPNPFVNGISTREYSALLQSAARPLFNRVLLGGYEPGSTIKPFIALAGLEFGLRKASDSVLSTGAFRLPGQQREYRDWRRGGHGRVNLSESLAQSVNTYYYQLAVDLGIDRLSGYMARFGFGAPTGVDLVGESSGILPTPSWKRGARNEPWYPGETVISGIGQGFWVVTPLQLTHAVATLAAGGRRFQPHLLRATQSGFDGAVLPRVWPEREAVEVGSVEHLQQVVDGMVAVMHGPTGTARAAAADATYTIAGKTGTAQRTSRTSPEQMVGSQLTGNLRHQALFVSFAPAKDPRIAVVVVVEQGGSGSRTAAPVARKIMDAWLLRNPA